MIRLRGMIDRLFRGEGHEDIETPAHENASFVLEIGKLRMGFLDLRDGVWTFRYSDEFRRQLAAGDGIRPLVEFPDAEKEYQSHQLWAFFLARIPSPSQDRIRDTIQQRGLDRKNSAQLLREFGARSIANPFYLRPVV
jgi:hypothetical protein